ncbi:HSF-type DNA-binding-domain-containing protein [Armillaria novae-zelandiae]|uniref:HSF-type DNA-binding-domain-containing protein n=1 Tax=Armillaria novae-zelandiae TaxID=153914 RepID=A0AA39PUD3_9AGAR|nr:HSF-type DNA-binding-domain-containing protein [Armillaria novae-zelandiae]
MADLYPPRHYSQANNMLYPSQLIDDHDDHDLPDPAASGDQKSQHQTPKNESKPQATFLTKLYALLERPENQHMIRWDPQGEHIIVERPEQLALHVLPSIYRQSRFASFSRQLNIYGFMRKVNLRNVDPAIDDPDASTWSHPTLNRHSPPEVVANFKRRVPPRLPKPRKRDTQESLSIPPPRSAIGMGPVPLSVPQSHKVGPMGRARGFSAPGSYTPLSQNGAAPAPSWNGGQNNYRSALPPLTVPSDPPTHISQSGMYSHAPSHHPGHHSLSPTADEPPFAYGNTNPYPSSYQEPQNSNWFPPVNNGSSSHNGSLSSLLNPSSNGGYSRPTPTINTSYSSPFSSMPMQTEHSASSLSPDSHSRPTTGYSMSSVSSMPYQDEYHSNSRPSSSHHHNRPMTPPRPTSSSKSPYPSNSLSIRRARRHSQAISPYPSPMYDHPSEHQRPSTSPQPSNDHHPHHSHSHHSPAGGNVPRVRSMIQLPSVLPSVDHYSFSPQAEFAYSSPMNDYRPSTSGGRPSTSTSSISAASHTSSSQANTPPVTEGFGSETDINRYSPDFGFVQMNEHLTGPGAGAFTKEI